MNIKERFTVYNNVVSGTTIITDNKYKCVISEIEAHEICMKEYGKSFSEKAGFLSRVIDSILENLELYNSSCPVHFEISYEDVIRKLKERSREKYLKDIIKADEKDGLYDE